MDEKTKAQVKGLEWFVGFANQDLETIGAGDRAKLLVEAEDYLFPGKEMREFQDHPLTRKQLGKMAWAVEDINKGSRQYWDIILHLHELIRELFDRYLLPTVRPSGDKVHANLSEAPSSYIYGADEFLWRVTTGFKVPYRIAILYLTASQDDYVRFKVCMLLEGFSDHALRVCPGCNKYFFNSTRKEREFCENRKCMNKVLTQRRREANRAAYNEEQRKRMYQRYEPKIGRRKPETDVVTTKKKSSAKNQGAKQPTK
jgi:hypothetical protein